MPRWTGFAGSTRRFAMGDKGKKEKDKGQKQKARQHEQEAKAKQDKQPKKIPK
jgi:hypothetical protein